MNTIASDKPMTAEEEFRLKQQKLFALKRQLLRGQAKDKLAVFMHLMLPDEVEPENPYKSEYQETAHGKLLCEIVQDIESGKRKRVAISIPPQHGKTWHLSTYGPAWLIGRNPRAKIMIATYNEQRADELGEAFRKVVTSQLFQTIFPGVQLDKGMRGKSTMGTTAGGKIYFTGTGGTVTGRTAQYFFIDDPIKDDKEVQSDIAREDLWKWFFSVAFSRGNNKTRIGVVHTRWHTDDLIGRLCDPTHPERGKQLKHRVENWHYFNISGVIEDKKLADALGLVLKVPTDPQVIQAFGLKPMVALWEADKDLAHFAEWKLGDPRTFSALVMGKPTVEDGEFFKREWLLEYGPEELPTRLRKYGASDHAVSEKEHRDYTVAGCIGIDEQDVIWVLPDITWDRMETDRTVEELLYQFRTHKPDLWWMESELISKSFGPFLKKRMMEERIYTTIEQVTVSKDKRTRARSIQGRLQHKRVRFPRFAPWWADARAQILQFPYGANDDFVDWLSHIGMGLLKETKASAPSVSNDNVIHIGSPAWVLKSSLERARREKRESAVRGW